MRIGNGSLVYRGAASYAAQRRAPMQRPAGPSRAEFGAQLDRLQSELTDLRQLLESARLGGVRRRAPIAQGVNLGISLAGTRAALVSTEEVNTRTTGISTATPQWAGASTADPTIGGTYQGTADDTLTVEVANVLGNGTATIDVFDSEGNRIDRFQRRHNDPIDKEYALSNGLTITFADGDFVKGDTFTLDVYADVDGAIDPDGAVGVEGHAGADFDEGLTVTDGSFTVNGVEIQVAASDSVNDIMQRISASEAGVQAAYDAATELVTITSVATGPDAQVALADDTSGLLAALKLDGLATAYGQEAEADRAMADVDAFAGVVAGQLTINGQTVDIDPAAQSIRDVVAAINDVDGATALLTTDGRLRIVGSGGQQLQLSDTSGLLDAAGIGAGTYVGRRSTERRISNLLARRIAAETQQVHSALEALAANGGGGLAERIGDRLERLIDSSFDEPELKGYARATGLDDLADGRNGSLARASREVRRRYGDVSQAWTGQGGRGGLLRDITDVIESAEESLLRVNVRI